MLQQYMSKNVQCHDINTNPKLESTHMSINGEMETLWKIYNYGRIQTMKYKQWKYKQWEYKQWKENELLLHAIIQINSQI